MTSAPTKAKRGFMTAIIIDGVAFGLYAANEKGLEAAYNHVTFGKIPFDRDMVEPVRIEKQEVQP